MKFFRKTAGSISIFLIMILLPLYTCLYLAIDSARWSAAKAKLSGAMNLTGNAALNSYDLALKDYYGLFAMGTDESSMQSQMASIFSGTAENTDYENFINSKVQSFELTYKSASSLARPVTLERTVTDYMKYRAPYTFLTGVSQKIHVFQQAPAAASVMEKSADYYDSMKGVSKELTEIAEHVEQQESQIETDETSGYDAEGQKKIIRKIQSGLKGLRKQVRKTEDTASAWKSALDNMEDSEAKSLLAGDYKTTAAVLSEEGISSLESDLEQDLAALDTWQEGQDPPTLAYRSNPLYQYIQSSGSTEATESETANAQSVQSGLATIAGTDVEQYVSLGDISIASLLGSEASAIESLGSTAVPDSSSVRGGNETRTLLSNVKKGLSSLTGSTDSLMSDCYNEEFINGMFSCYTNTATDTSLTHTVYGDKPVFRAETEYIIFGKDNARQNVVLAAELIFGIRFVLNAVYVFSNARMRAEALSLATALSGWTGAGIVLVQNLILTAWAMAESVLDVSTLLKGGDVPIYKNAATWTLGVGGIAGKLQEGAANYAVNKIDDIFLKIQNTADDKIDELSGSALNYFEQSTEGAVESLTNMVVTPVESTVTAMIGDRTQVLSGYSRDQIRSMLENAVAEADNGSRGYKMAKSLFDQYCLDSLTDTIYGNYEYLFAEDDTLAKLAATKIENAITDCYTGLFQQVKNAVEQATSGTKSRLNSALGSAKEEAKANTLEVISDYTEELSQLLGNESTPKTTAVSSYSGMSMSYRDYLRVFTFLAVAKNSTKTGVLTRTAKVMQINCAKAESGFQITRCFTQVQLNAVLGIAAHKVHQKEVYQY